MDHRTAAGEFQTLVKMRTEHFRDGKDGAVSDEDSKAYEKRVSEFKKNCTGPGVRVSIFGGIGSGAFETAEKSSFLVQESKINFDWAEAQRLLHKAESIADQTAEWWPWRKVDDGTPARERKRQEGIDQERRPHVDRAFNLMTAVLSAINQEHHRVDAADGTEAAKETRTTAYGASIKVVAEDIARAEERLDTAAQRRAQLTYSTGMLWGALLILLLCAVIGAVFIATDTRAANGVALLAGAAGAVVSVLQRMTSGTLRLDVHAGSVMLLRYGMLRPAIGAVIGMAIATLFAAGLLPDITLEPSEELAFAASVGFLAGFNERFAQDMLANTGNQMAK